MCEGRSRYARVRAVKGALGPGSCMQRATGHPTFSQRSTIPRPSPSVDRMRLASSAFPGPDTLSSGASLARFTF